jgi:putative protease
MDKIIGKLAHYFDHIGVAAFLLKSPLAIGDTIKIKGNKTDFTQTITSMQIEHKPVEKAKKGDDIAIKVDQPAKEGDSVFKV